jgi:hypothetical protein
MSTGRKDEFDTVCDVKLVQLTRLKNNNNDVFGVIIRPQNRTILRYRISDKGLRSGFQKILQSRMENVPSRVHCVHNGSKFDSFPSADLV